VADEDEDKAISDIIIMVKGLDRHNKKPRD
jgi:hypothetical protein